MKNKLIIEPNETKKVGLLTYHHTTNFGSLLQTFALYKTITEIGYTCEIIDYRNEAVEQREFIKKLYQCRSLREIKHHLQYSKYRRKKAKEFALFLCDKFDVSSKIYYRNNISEANSRYDCFVIGSDLVWDFSINGHDTTYMLDFVESGKGKIAFASSVGEIWHGTEMREVENLLIGFDAIGVREYAIQNKLNELLNRTVDFVCDPTMLIDPAEWEKMASNRIIQEDYVLCYMSNDGLTMYKDAVDYGEKHGLPVYLISYDWVPDNMRAIRPYRIEEFLSLIRYADTVFTASYHGMLFSLYFNKNFYYYNRGWKERMKSISEYLGLSDREHWTPDKGEEIIDYSLINSRMEKFREESKSRLAKYLGKKE